MRTGPKTWPPSRKERRTCRYSSRGGPEPGADDLGHFALPRAPDSSDPLPMPPSLKKSPGQTYPKTAKDVPFSSITVCQCSAIVRKEAGRSLYGCGAVTMDSAWALSKHTSDSTGCRLAGRPVKVPRPALIGGVGHRVLAYSSNTSRTLFRPTAISANSLETL